jgi:hypothetical protein
MGILFLSLFGMIPLVMFASQWDGHLHEQKSCYELKKIDNKMYKLNTCNGDIEEMKFGDKEK